MATAARCRAPAAATVAAGSRRERRGEATARGGNGRGASRASPGVEKEAWGCLRGRKQEVAAMPRAHGSGCPPSGVEEDDRGRRWAGPSGPSPWARGKWLWPVSFILFCFSLCNLIS